jgi:hypothetical protein
MKHFLATLLTIITSITCDAQNFCAAIDSVVIDSYNGFAGLKSRNKVDENGAILFPAGAKAFVQSDTGVYAYFRINNVFVKSRKEAERQMYEFSQKMINCPLGRAGQFYADKWLKHQTAFTHESQEPKLEKLSIIFYYDYNQEARQYELHFVAANRKYQEP